MKRITKEAAKKKKQKSINLKLVIVFLIVVIVISIIAIRNLPTIRMIEVKINIFNSDDENNVKVTKEEILTLANLNVGDKLFKYLRSEISERIEQNPYIESAKIQRDLSGKVKIEITQREPKYLINYLGEYIYIDREGYVLERNSQSNDNPIIIGFSTDFSELAIGNSTIRLNQEDLEKLQIANNIMATLESNGVENKISLIDVTNKKDFILKLDDDGKIVYIGDGSDLNTRILYLKKILETENGHMGIIYINGNLDEGYVYFKEQ